MFLIGSGGSLPHSKNTIHTCLGYHKQAYQICDNCANLFKPSINLFLQPNFPGHKRYEIAFFETFSLILSFFTDFRIHYLLFLVHCLDFATFHAINSRKPAHCRSIFLTTVTITIKTLNTITVSTLLPKVL